MKKRIFSIALCSAMLMSSNMALLKAEYEPEEEPIIEEAIYPEDSIDQGPGNEVNFDGDDDEGTLVTGINVEYHSPKTIRNYYVNNRMNYVDSKYSVNPSTTSPYAAGKLSDETLNEALKTVNLIRFIAGLNYDVTLDTDCSEKVQAGALLNAVNNTISKTPAKPSGMSTSLYDTGYAGNQNADMASGYTSLENALTDYWLRSNDSSMLGTLENRRWLLNSAMSKTGFGQVGQYSGMYSHDESRTADRTSNVWPAQSTPVELFSSQDPWSVSTGNIEDPSAVEVTMTNNANTSIAYVFSAADSSNGYFAVDNSEYGVPGAIIWRPNNFTYADGSSYDVRITGLVGKDIHYTVNFFTMDISQETVVVTPSKLYLDVNQSQNITAKIEPSTISDSFRGIQREDKTVIGWASVATGVFKITGLKPGKSYFKINTNNDKSGYCYVTVKGVLLDQTSLSLKAGGSSQLSASVFLEPDADQTVTWSSSNTNIATVNSSGLVTGVAEGTATITATTGSYTATCTVTVTDPITVESVSLSLKEKIEANFYVYVPDKELDSTDINIAFNGTTTTKHAADITPKTFNGKACRVVSVATLAKQMRDEITVTVTKKDTTEKKYLEYKDANVTDGLVFKIEDYVKLVEANSTNAKLIDLVHKMDNYGKYAQTQFKYNLDSFDKADDIPSDYQDSRLTPYLVNNAGSVTGLAYASGSLELESDTGLRVYYNLTGTDAISTYTFTVDGKKVTPTKKGTQYYVSIKNIPARLMSKSHTIVVTDKSGNQLTTIYSGLSYPAAVVASSAAPDSLKNLCRSIDLYAEAALIYFGE